MRVIVPYVNELLGPDARVLRMADFLGVSYDALSADRIEDVAERLQRKGDVSNSCVVVRPPVLEGWLSRDANVNHVVDFLLSQFPRILVHGVRVDPFDSAIVCALSKGELRSVEAADRHGDYEIDRNAPHICEAFAGLSFGPVNADNDHVCSIREDSKVLQSFISIGGRPFMGAIRRKGSEVLFVASEDVLDIDADVGDMPLPEYFSRFVPLAMALRYIAGNQCWRPYTYSASVVIDDPLLRKSYGFLNYDYLLSLTKKHNFHTTIAFIPHNSRRNSAQTVRMFRENPERLSICFHGNDHTEAEFGSKNECHLNTLLHVAESRMDAHRETTQLSCDSVMVFPQGKFSIEAMKILKFHNFRAAVNSVSHPADEAVRLTIAELAQPAVLRYGGFPLFIRKSIQQYKDQDIAFNAFFGRPILIVEHHETFRQPELLVGIVARINSLVPKVCWANLGTVVERALLVRKAGENSDQIRAYSRIIHISNTSNLPKHFLVCWSDPCDGTSLVQASVDGRSWHCQRINGSRLQVTVELSPATSRTLSISRRHVRIPLESLGLRWNIHACLRRRLSEVRDNYLSKNHNILGVAERLRQHLPRI